MEGTLTMWAVFATTTHLVSKPCKGTDGSILTFDSREAAQAKADAYEATAGIINRTAHYTAREYNADRT